MKFIFGILFALFCTTSFAVDSSVNSNVYIKQGGAELNVKTGGSIKVRDTLLTSVLVSIASIQGTASGTGIAPVPGSISSISCLSDTAISDTPTILTAAINGTNITGGAVTITSAGSNSYTRYTATPSALNTVAAGDVLKVTSDGGTNTASNGYCVLYITP